MIEIRYTKSKAGLDNIFDLFHINDYIPMPLKEQRNEGTELKFYLSLFQRFNMIDSPETGVAFFWNTYFTCRFNDIVFRMIYDNEYDIAGYFIDYEIAYSKALELNSDFVIEKQRVHDKDIEKTVHYI